MNGATPKKFNYKRPSLWIGVYKDEIFGDICPGYFRIRILYPNGFAIWTDGSSCGFYDPPCWQGRGCPEERLITNYPNMIREMTKYDQRFGRHTYFCGYL